MERGHVHSTNGVKRRQWAAAHSQGWDRMWFIGTESLPYL
jgi:hypothetical protein